jgi:outer membrane lipoprotein-sorting protein
MIRKTLLMCAAAAALLCMPSATYAQTAEEIVAKNLAAKGGEAKLKAVQTLRQTGSVKILGQPAHVTTTFMRPNLSRLDITIQGTTLTMMFDGEKAWMLNPMMGPDPMQQPAEQAEMIKDQADIDGPLVDYKSKGSTIELVGTEDVGGKKAFHLRITRKALPPVEVFIDTTTYLDIKSVSVVPGSGTMEILFADYRSVDGLVAPFSIKSLAAGMVVAELKVEKIEINPTLPPDTFKIKK